LSDIAQDVFLIYRKDKLPAEEYWIKKIENNKKIKILYNSNVVEIFGRDRIEGIRLDRDFAGKKELHVDGLFIECGSNPSVDFADNLGIEKDETGFIKIQKGCETSVCGIWAAGDITDGSNKFFQVITAASEGAIAAKSIYNYLRK
jgi:thioredoxin reductase